MFVCPQNFADISFGIEAVEMIISEEMMLCENGDAQGAIRCSLDKADRFWPRWDAANDAQRVVWRQDIMDEAMDAEA